MRRDIDAARGEEAGAGLEQIERGRERDLGVGRERAQARARRRDRRRCQEALDQRARPFGKAAEAPSAACSRKRSAISPTERPPTA